MRRDGDDADDALRCLVRATGMRGLVCVPPTAFPPKAKQNVVELFTGGGGKHEAMYEVRRQQCC